MLTKLLSVLVAGKGGAVAAAAIVAGATTVSVMTTSPEIKDTVNAVSEAVSGIVSPGMSELAKAGKIHDECEKGQPVVVAQRNAADKLLRDAYQDEHKRLVDLRGGKDVDHQKANEILRDAERDLRGVLTHALNDVARETLGREGQLKEREASPSASPSASPAPSASPSASPSPSASASATPSASPSGSPTPKPSCTPKPSASASATPTASASLAPSASPSESPTAELRGRAEVAGRVTLNAKLQGIVDKAKTDMKSIVDKAQADLAALPPAEHGKSGEKGRPEEQRGRSEEQKDAEHGKPSEHPGGRPSSAPGRP